MESVLVTNVTQYTGPGVVDTLVEQGYHVICHDPAFADETTRNAYDQRPSVTATAAQSPDAIREACRAVDRLVFNDVYPNTPTGEYQVQVGLYHQPTGERMPILVNGEIASDRLLLAPVMIKGSE